MSNMNVILQLFPSSPSSLFIMLISWFSSFPTFPEIIDWSEQIAID